MPAVGEPEDFRACSSVRLERTRGSRGNVVMKRYIVQLVAFSSRAVTERILWEVSIVGRYTSAFDNDDAKALTVRGCSCPAMFEIDAAGRNAGIFSLIAQCYSMRMRMTSSAA